MSEPTPSYYPAGWDRERVLNISAAGEAGNWTQEEADTFCEGLRADLGQMGFEQFWDEVETREKVARGSPIVPEEPPFMEFMRECREKRGWTWDRWGFVVYKSPEIVDAAQWTACKERFMQILHDQAYQDEYRMHPGFDECLSKMTFQWMEDVKEGAGDIASIAEIYSSSSPPAGLDHEMCLYITPSSLHSILNTALPSTSKRRYRIDIPFVVAIFAHHVIQHKTLTTKHEDKKDDKEEEEEEEEAEGEDWCGFFNAAVETLLTDFFTLFLDDKMTPYELAGQVSGDDVWCGPWRDGVHKAGVGYWNSRIGRRDY